MMRDYFFLLFFFIFLVRAPWELYLRMPKAPEDETLYLRAGPEREGTPSSERRLSTLASSSTSRSSSSGWLATGSPSWVGTALTPLHSLGAV